MKEPKALISSVQHYTIHDGPGIRTAVFFKGCTMNCIWCSNPETISPQQQLGIYPSKCLSGSKCGYCVKGCKQKGEPIIFGESGKIAAIKMTKDCESCLSCADICPPRAIKLWGQYVAVPELMAIIEGDRSFYDKSGGGVTLNGGEVMLQWEFAAALLRECQKAKIHTCVETALHCPQAHMEAVYEYADLVISDIKHMNSQVHKSFAGVGNELILSNLKKTVEMEKSLILRTPVVPEYNADEASIRAIAKFIKNDLQGKILSWQLLPFRKLGTEKYASLLMDYPMKDINSTREDWEQKLPNLANMIARDYHLPVTAGTGE